MDRSAEEYLGTEWWRASDDALLETLREMEDFSRQWHAEKLRVITEAQTRGLALSKGYPSLVELLRDDTRITRNEAKRRIAQARSTEKLATLDTGARAGVLGPDHIEVISDLIDSLPASVPDEDRISAGDILVTAAAGLDAQTLRRRIGTELIARLDPDGPEPGQHDPYQPANELHCYPRRDGRLRIRGEFDAETGAVLMSQLSPLAKPRPTEGKADLRGAGERLGDAFAELVQLAANAALAPVEGGERPHLNVTMPLAELVANVGSVSLGDGARLTPEQLRRIACDARVIPVVLGRESQPLDVGTAQRTAPPAIRRALIVRDRGCAFPTCSRPPGWTDAHHIRHWADGGPTEVGNMVLLCRMHHGVIHRSEWEVRVREGIPEFIPPAYIDPQRTPRRNAVPRTRAVLRRHCFTG